jgi:phosphopantothenoylcysteine decarboxylase/phosphopantothenate--cysteine ligase
MGVTFVNPRLEEAKAKFPIVKDIVDSIISLIGLRDLDGLHFVITAGPTRGWVDRVRFITNPSTGKMGIALAEEVIARGGKAKLILGPTQVTPAANIDTQRVDTTNDMLDSVLKSIEHADVFISSAAILDYEPSEIEDSKIPSGSEGLSIDLVPTKKVIEEVRKKRKDLFIVGFKVESGIDDNELLKRAKVKIDKGICDLMVANDAARKGVAFGGDTNEVLIIDASGILRKISLSSKRHVASEIIDVVLDKMKH